MTVKLTTSQSRSHHPDHYINITAQHHSPVSSTNKMTNTQHRILKQQSLPTSKHEAVILIILYYVKRHQTQTCIHPYINQKTSGAPGPSRLLPPCYWTFRWL